jgi:hypothetical protein
MASRRRTPPPHPNVPVRTAVQTVLAAIRSIRPYRQIASTLPGFDARCFDDLSNAATAALAAHEFCESALTKTPSEANELAACVSSARTARNALRVALAALVEAGLVQRDVPGRIPAGRSYKAIATELLGLCVAFERCRDTVRGKTAVSDLQLAKARSIATALTTSIAHPRGEDHLEMTIAHRNAAFDRLLKLYTEVRRAIEFLRPRDVALDRIAPSLYARRSRAAIRRAA